MLMNLPTSIKVFGANIVPKPSDAGSWMSFYNNWDWTGWIKPQIDYACGNAVGANVIRLIGDFEGIRLGTFTQATYNANWLQLVSYVASLGARVYMCSGSFNQLGIPNRLWTNAQIYASINSLLSALSAYTPYIIGVDLMNEQNMWRDGIYGTTPNANAGADYIAIAAGVRAGGTTLPLTSSTDLGVGQATAQTWITSISSALDFLDFHMYGGDATYGNYTTTAVYSLAELQYWRTTYPNLDIIHGEFGSPESASFDTQVAFLSSAFDRSNNGDAHVRGGCLWAIQDQDSVSSNKWGMYSSTWTPRAPRISALQHMTGRYLQKAN